MVGTVLPGRGTVLSTVLVNFFSTFMRESTSAGWEDKRPACKPQVLERKRPDEGQMIGKPIHHGDAVVIDSDGK